METSQPVQWPEPEPHLRPVLETASTSGMESQSAQSYLSEVWNGLVGHALKRVESAHLNTPIGAVPGIPATAKVWHQCFAESNRHRMIQRIVQAISSSIDIADLPDEQMRNLVKYAENVERDVYGAANSSDEYYHAFTAKILRIRRELQLRRLIGRPVRARSDSSSDATTSEQPVNDAISHPYLPSLSNPGELDARVAQFERFINNLKRRLIKRARKQASEQEKERMYRIRESKLAQLARLQQSSQSYLSQQHSFTEASESAPSPSRENVKQVPQPAQQSQPQQPQVKRSKQSVRAVSCGVCLDDLLEVQSLDSKQPASTICGHLFCTGCIITVIKTQHRCPVCRKHLEMKDYHPIYM